VTIFTTLTRRKLVVGSVKNDADAEKVWRGSGVRARTENLIEDFEEVILKK
jgi:hypothetical protein